MIRKPDFNESELQFYTNVCILDYIKNINHNNSHLRIPTLRAESHLGYDTSFEFPDLPNPNGTGHNLFIQYKISKMVDGDNDKGGKYWNSWQEPYWFFSMVHKKNDIHQRNRLVDLNEMGYTSVYITNHMLSVNDLFVLFDQGTLIDELPTLFIDPSILRHVDVTFTTGSNYFLLHSIEKELKKGTLSSIIEGIKQTNLSKDLDELTLWLYKFGIPIPQEYVSFALSKGIKAASPAKEFNQFLFIKKTLLEFLNIHWVRF